MLSLIFMLPYDRQYYRSSIFAFRMVLMALGVLLLEKSRRERTNKFTLVKIVLPGECLRSCNDYLNLYADGDICKQCDPHCETGCYGEA